MAGLWLAVLMSPSWPRSLGTLGRELEERIRSDRAAEFIRQIRADSFILSSLPLEVRLPAREAYALALEHTF
ncbi:hypothetical protein JCM8208_004244 [Rhodotorula glutinis]